MATVSRNVSLDRTRTFLTLVVLLHHAVIPYTYYGHTDPAYSLSLDFIVLATDSFFMAMFFFLSGLFVWPALSRKAPTTYLRERLLRLGLPGAIGALVLIPIAYYSFAIRQNPDLTFSAFWLKTVTEGPWPSGPIWFLWVLLAFDLLAIFLYQISPKLVFPINRIAQQRPTRFWLFFAVVTWLVYIPLMIFFGNSHWLEFGPFVLQTSRILLYATYFLIGAGVGCANLSTGFLNREGELAKRRWIFLALTINFYLFMWFMVFIKRGILGNPLELPVWYHPIYGTFFVLFSASILFAILGFFLHSKSSRPNILDRMQAEAYGMFLVHYPIILWLQYLLFEQEWPAIVKAASAFCLTVALSWAVTVVLRKLPGATRVL